MLTDGYKKSDFIMYAPPMISRPYMLWRTSALVLSCHQMLLGSRFPVAESVAAEGF